MLRGIDIGSDHNLLKINFKVKLRVKTGNKYMGWSKIFRNGAAINTAGVVAQSTGRWYDYHV